MRLAVVPTQSFIKRITEAVSLEVKQPSPEVDSTPLPSDTVKSTWIYSSTLLEHGAELIKHRDNFTFHV
jgi:hypothetical protein